MRPIAWAASVLLIACAAGCGDRETAVLKVFHAGSLSVPFKEMEGLFEERNPGVDVQRESYGSAAAIRQVTELGRPADVIGSADYHLIDQLMIEPEPPWADWNVLFARNSVIIASTDADDEMTADNWPEVLARTDARVGMSNPNHDPCGYRSLYCVYLADAALGKEGLFRELILANSNVALEEGDDGAAIRVPEAAEYRGRLTMRPKETDLLALLEAGAIDYLFIYRSVAKQHGLHYVELPDEVNLSSPDLAKQYGRVAVCQYADLPDRSAIVRASPIVYGLTVPREAPNRELAERFAELVVSEAGREILERSGQAPLVPTVLSAASSREAVPAGVLQETR